MRAVLSAIGMTLISLAFAGCSGPARTLSSPDSASLADYEARRQEAHAAWRKSQLEGTVPGTLIWDCALCPKMMAKTPGGIWSGSADWDPERQASDLPLSSVDITHPYAVATHEVTRAEFKAFVAVTNRKVKSGCHTDRAKPGEWQLDPQATFMEPGIDQQDDHPVVCVSWQDAHDYLAWLNEQTTGGYRLPTEAEWHAAGFGGGYEFYVWGETVEQACMYANVLDASAAVEHPIRGALKCADSFLATAPVGRFRPSAGMSYDVIGNAAEWTATCELPAAGESATCERAIVKGGSWKSKGHELRLATRTAVPVGERNNSIGFRVAKALDDPASTLIDSTAYLLRGRQRLFQMNYQGALADLKQAVELDPRNSHAMSARGWGNFRVEKWDDAGKDFNAAVVLDPANAEAITGLGVVELVRGRPQSALQHIDKALSLAPEFSMAMSLRVLASTKAGHLEQALNDSTQAMRLSPTDIEILRLRVSLRAMLREWPETIGEVDELIRVFPILESAQVFAASSYSELLMDSDAVAAATRATRAHGSVDNYLLRANVRPWMDVRGRRADIDSALKVEPNSLPAIDALAQLESRIGNHEASLRAYTKWLESAPEDRNRVETLVMRGIEHLKLGNKASAQKDFGDAIGPKPFAGVFNNLCWYLTVANVALDRAMNYCDQALKLEPDNPAYLDSKATLLLQLGKYQEAIALYDRAIKLRPVFPHSTYGRGVAAQLHCKCEDAGKADLALAVDIAPATQRNFERYGLPAPYPPSKVISRKQTASAP